MPIEPSTLNHMKKLLYLATAILLGCACSRQNQQPIALTWEMGQNDVTWGVCESYITITNTGKDSLKRNWALHYCQMSVSPLEQENEELHITQVCASYHILTPTAHFQALAPQESKTYTLRHKGNIVRTSAGPQGAFIVMNEGEPQRISIDYKLSDKRQEFRRNAGFVYADGKEVYTINARFDNTNTETAAAESLHILPTPKETIHKEGVCDTQQAIREHKTDESLQEEGYRLIIKKDSICTVSSTETGQFYAEQTLQRLIENYGTKIPCAVITDYPDIAHRGFMLDIARNYTPKEEVMKILDAMAAYKMNVFHFHLTDDEGWRIEIPGLPELTEMGSKRGYTTDEKDCLYPAYCGGWDTEDMNTTANGYLTRADFIEILRHANALHIQVIPEIDMPGHIRSAIKAMEVRYKKYIDSDPEKATEYLLTDFDDTSVYESAQHYTDNVMCIALPSCYRFVYKIIDEIEDMYREAGVELHVFHIGGDEVAPGAWVESPVCKAFMEEHQLQELTDLKDYFLTQVISYLTEKDIQVAGWEEIALRKGIPNEKFAHSNVLSYCWNSVPEWKGDEKPYLLANGNYPVIISCVTNCYLDMCYLNHEEERGLHWGGYTDEYTSFDLQPFDLYKSVRRTMKGEYRDIEAYANSGKTALREECKKNIRGVQAHLFAETIRSTDQVEEYMFPKILGIMERAWNAYPDFSDYPSALNAYNYQIMEYELPRLQSWGYSFHLSQPGIIVENGLIKMNSPYEKAEIRYTTDGSKVTKDSPLYRGPFAAESENISAKCFYLGKESNTTRL